MDREVRSPRGTTEHHDTLHIDAALLERMERIARGFPGHIVSVDERPEEAPVLRIDGIHAKEIADSLFGSRQYGQ